MAPSGSFRWPVPSAHPYWPQTNGKGERFNRTLQQGWAHAYPCTSESQRTAAYPELLHRYNHHRPHTARCPDGGRLEYC
jgi:hypothetical protein